MANIPEHQRNPWIRMQRGREPKPDAGPWTFVLIVLFWLGVGAIGILLLITIPQLSTGRRALWILIKGFIGVCCLLLSYWGLRYTWQELRDRN
jgi:hypothetical protein